MNKTCFLLIACLFSGHLLNAQTKTSKKDFSIPLKAVVAISEKDDPFAPDVKVRRLPKPHPGVDAAVIAAAKKSNEDKYRSKRAPSAMRTALINSPVMLRNFSANSFNFFVPNDNDMAISNNEVVGSVSNTMIWSKDLTTNQTYGSYLLHTLTASLGLQQEEFDPKIIYDPQSDRFIFLCLNGFNDSTSNILLGFSQANTSFGNWNFYALPGNPLNNNLWTDFPMLAVSEQEVFITVNLLYNDSSWQTGFNESIIWQIRKEDGYNGVALTTQLHSGILYGNSSLRNLCPVRGGSTVYGPNMYFISNRNFAASNDSIFLVEVTDTIGAAAQTVNITALTTGTAYHMPVDADQPFADKLIVNDARTLGAFIENNTIQFVCSTLDTASGYDGMYHGVISGLPSAPVATASIYTNPPYDLGYPNIAYAGSGPGDNRSVCSILYTSAADFPGTAALAYDGLGVFSPLTIVKSGLGYTNILNGDERWGDYTGCQTKYNASEIVWISGSYSQLNHTTRTYVAELSLSPQAGLIENQGALQEAEVYPNPTEDIFTLAFNLQTAGLLYIDLYDINGKLVKKLYEGRLRAGENAFTFRTASLSTGTYFLKISDQNRKEIAQGKVIRH